MNQHARANSAPIPFIDVAAQRRRLGSAIDDAVARVLSHCQFILGPEVRAVVVRELRAIGFGYVTLDLQGFRSGSLNEVLPTVPGTTPPTPGRRAS